MRLSSGWTTVKMPSNCDEEGNFFLSDFNKSLDDLFIPVARFVRERPKGSVMSFYINSDGGDATRALSLVELIRWGKSRGITVETFVLSEANSAGSIVAVAGSKGHRYVADNGSYMLHWGTTEQTANSPESSRRMHDANVRHFNNIFDHYERNCDIPALAKKLRHDHLYITAEQAIEWNMADGTINHRE